MLIFVVGFIYRVLTWTRAPVPFHVPTVCGQQKSLPWIKTKNLESPHNTLGVIARMSLEVLLFRSLFRNERVELKRAQKLIYGGNKYLWLGGLGFHWSLLIILFRHLRFFAEPVPSAVLYNGMQGGGASDKTGSGFKTNRAGIPQKIPGEKIGSISYRNDACTDTDNSS